MAEGPKEGLACVSLCRKTIHLLGAVQASRLCFFRTMRQLLLYQFSLTFPLVQNSPVTSTPPTCSPSGLSPFPKKANCHVDHKHDYYGLNQKPNRHFAASLTPSNCPTNPSQRRNRQTGEGELLMSRFFTNNPLEIPPTPRAFIDLPLLAT